MKDINQKQMDPKSLTEKTVAVYSDAAKLIGQYPLKSAQLLVALGLGYAVSDQDMAYIGANQTPDQVLRSYGI